MNIVSWNVRGLGKPAKRFLVRDFLNLHFAEVCCLQESKLELVSQLLWCEIGGPRLDQFAFAPAKGSAGGIIVGWNSADIIGQVMFVGEFSLTMAFFSKRFNFRWRCTSVYGPVDRSRKQAFWDELRTVSGESVVPMVICGDFNAIFALEDKVTGVPNLEDIRCANAFL